MIIPLRSMLKILPFMAVSFALSPQIQAADLTDQNAPVLTDSAASGGSARRSSNADLLLQMQQLQQEMQTLRNLVEQQEKIISQLQKDGRDRYLDTDRRLSDLSDTLTRLQKDGVNSTPVQGSAEDPALPVISGTAKEAYQQAYALVKAQKFDKAITAYQAFIKNYPESSLLANAYYWLGELYMVKNLTQEAERVFLTVVERYPKSLKVPDASYKLGLVYARYGQQEKAIAQMKEVEQQFSDSTAAKLAKQFLAAQKK